MAEPSVTADARRLAQVRMAVRVETLTVAWMVIEAALSIGAGLLAGSAILTAFGVDSLIELISGGILLWRLRREVSGASIASVERAERRATWIVAVALLALCLYVLLSAVYGLVARVHPSPSPVGIGVSAAAVIVMPWLGLTKRRLAGAIDSPALRGDAASSFTCAAMAATVLAGLGADALAGWWWAEDLAALVFLFWLVGETREALEEAREGDRDAEAEDEEGS
jgi:divalent metal cation (Fe/Co/Zn/Cd) transporter